MSWTILFLWQVRAQTRTESARSYDSHSSSTISSDAVGGNKPPPPPVALKPSVTRLNQPAEEQGPRNDEEDPANKSFLGKVRAIISVCSIFIPKTCNWDSVIKYIYSIPLPSVVFFASYVK